MKPIEMMGFAPDIDPSTPGVFIDCRNIDPLITGFRASPSIATAPINALAEGVIGGAVLFKFDGSARLFAGTLTKLYHRAASVWADVSASGGYSGASDTRWSFAPFGDAMYASNGVQAIQKTVTGAFTAVAGAPKAKIIESAAGFMLAFDTDDATNGVRRNGWASSDIRNADIWTPGPTTQAANGILIDTPGGITAAKKLGDSCIVYKERSMYRGDYIGPPIYWQFPVIPGGERIGCVGQNAVVDIGIGHVFVGPEDIYYYDGVRPVSIGGGVKEWFFANLLPGERSTIRVSVDFPRSLVRIHFANIQSTGPINDCLTWNFKTRRWGRALYGITATLDFVSAAMTYDQFSDTYGTYDSFPAVSWDSSFWLPGTISAAVFDLNGQLGTLNGGALNSEITLGDVGDDAVYTTLSRIRPSFIDYPDTGAATVYGREYSGDTMIEGETVTLEDARFDPIQDWRWHRARMRFTGAMEVNAVTYSLHQTGTE